MDAVVESAIISAAATVISVGGTVAVAIVGFRVSRSANQASIEAVKATTDKTVDAARHTNMATLDATRDGQIADLYSRAIEQLGSDRLDVRIGGIYALERVARDSFRDHPTVMEVLGAFIREHSQEQWPQSEPDAPVPHRPLRPDVQAAIAVIRRRDSSYDRERINLSGARLAGVDLSDVDLTRADLARADLSGAVFIRANLAEANLADANCESATFFNADLRGAKLNRTNLNEAFLRGANLTDADFTNPLSRHISRFWRGDAPADVVIPGASLVRANLSDADLSRADLRDAILSGTNFTGAELKEARILGHVFVPNGWVRDASTGQLHREDADPQ
jgi:Pentapeptide repeats (8 copies)